MNTHNPHRVLIFSGYGCLSKICIKFLQIFNIADKMKQPFVTGLLIIRCLFHQHIQVGLAGLSCRHGRNQMIVSSLLKHPVNQFMNWKIRAECPETLQHKPKTAQFPCQIFIATTFFLFLLSTVILRLLQKPAHSRKNPPILAFLHTFPVKCHQLCQLLVRDAHKRRFQHSSQGNILHGIVNDSQHT